MADVLEEAQRLYRESLDASREQRQQIAEDLAFSDPSNPEQWDDAVRIQRETDPGGKRPCLTLDQTGQYVANVAGQIEKQPPSLHAIPVGGGADKQAAEQIDGRFRHIEHASRASQHYARAITSAARTGVGYLTVRPEYVDRALGWQEPRIGSEADPLKVILDPWSEETDGADTNFGFVMTAVSVSEYERRWKGKEQRDFGDLESQRVNDRRKSVLTAEQWLKVSSTRKVLVYLDAQGQEATGTEEDYWKACQAAGLTLPFLSDYTDKQQTVQWRRMSGAGVLEESEYPADSIGIIPVYGYVGFKDGRMRYAGIPRRARSAQQAYNYHKSELMMPGAQLLASKRATAGVESIWDRAQTQRRAFMPYNDQDEDGPISPPTLIKIGSALVDHASGAESALRDIQASIGMYQANLGAPSNESSGVAIESRKQQGEASTAHFPSHMAASLGQVGKIVMQMDARLSDTRRQSPILGIDGTPGSVTIDPGQQQAFARTPEGVSINPRVGNYGVRVVVGASYSTQRSQTNAAFAEIMRGNPELAPTVAPFWAQTLDFPGSDKFAQAMGAMAPPPVKAILQPEGAEQQADPAKLAQELDQCKQALQEATGIAHETQKDLDEIHGEMSKLQLELSDKEEAEQVAWFKAQTERLKVTGANEQQMQAIVTRMINEMLMSPGPLPGDDPQPGPNAWQPQPLPAGGEPEMPGDGPGMDNTPQHEQAEAPAFEQQEATTEPDESGEGMMQ